MGWCIFVSRVINWIRGGWRQTASDILRSGFWNQRYRPVEVGGTLKIVSMNDVGTRMQHLADLHELWTDGVGILSQSAYKTEFNDNLVEELHICIKHLENHMTKDYIQSDYAAEINKIGTTPPPEE
jgi:hypothetical protein